MARHHRSALLLAGALSLLTAAPSGAATITATVPNAIVVLTVHSWCGGTRHQSHQLNGPHVAGLPDVYVQQHRSTLACFF